MDARSIAATAANQGILTPATEFDGELNKYQYHFDKEIKDIIYGNLAFLMLESISEDDNF